MLRMNARTTNSPRNMNSARDQLIRRRDRLGDVREPLLAIGLPVRDVDGITGRGVVSSLAPIARLATPGILEAAGREEAEA
jgi:hypothetical protein